VPNLLLAALVALAPPALDDPWPDFRGPGRDGRAPEASRPPRAWAEGRNVRWKAPIHGRGWSTPAVGDGRVWLTTADEEGHELSVVCLDLASGAVLLDRVLFRVEEPQERHELNSYASPSPVLADGRVFVHFGSEGTAALAADDFELLWQRRDLRCDHMVGAGSSPIVEQGRLVFHVDGIDVQYVVCLDARDGRELWRTPRSVDFGDAQPDLRKAYGTPVVAGEGGEALVIGTGALASYAYELASGRERWRVRHPGFSMSSRPVLAGELVLVGTGFMRPELWALRLGGAGDVTDSHVAWKLSRGVPTMPSPVVVGEHVYLVDDGGVASCIALATGESAWRERLEGAYSASLVAAGGALYAFDRDGLGTVLRAAPTFERLAENRLDDGCMASPVVVGNALLVRTRAHLYRIEEGDD